MPAVRRQDAATRAIRKIKARLLAANVWVPPSPRELFLMAADWRRWAETERDPEKAAECRKHGDLCAALAKSTRRREVEAKAKKRPRPS
jgi:hypothetical protein